MKVLLISHNPISTYQNMGKTFLSLFSSFDKGELCQLYIYPTIPDIDICQSYYRMTDRDIFNSFFQFGHIHSKIITGDMINTDSHGFFESETDEKFYRKNKKNVYTILARDMIWKLAHWFNNDLKDWLCEQKPSCIFLAPGGSRFIYDIALKISQELNIKVFTYICDEYYFVKKPARLIERIRLQLLQKKIRELMKKTEGLITICDELSEVYHDEFDVNTHTIYTGTNYVIAKQPDVRLSVCALTYMGNLSYKRYESLADVGRALDNINAEIGGDYRLYIYSPRLPDEAQAAFSTIQSIEYCGFVTGQEFMYVMKNADILLHVESFAEEEIERVKHSISTKIADSLACGKCIFTYGPPNVASIRYLKANNAAFCVCDKNELKSVLYDMLTNSQKRQEIIENALELAQKNHDPSVNSNEIRHILAE